MTAPLTDTTSTKETRFCNQTDRVVSFLASTCQSPLGSSTEYTVCGLCLIGFLDEEPTRPLSAQEQRECAN